MLSWILNNKTKKKKVTMLAACFFLVSFFIFAFYYPVFAQGNGNFGIDRVGSLLPLGGEDIWTIAAKIIRIALSLLGIIVVVYILYAGFLWMTSGGNEDKIAEAKKTIINASIGLAIILGSLAITQFIIMALSDATGSALEDQRGGGRGINFDSFSASGALGRIVKEHYPVRDQKDVPRNTRIAVTFREPIAPSSIINNTNGNNIIGDCINTNDPAFDWSSRFCDQLNTSSLKIFTGTTTPVFGLEAAALTLLEGADQNAYTFMFRPLTLLGSPSVKMNYTVDLTKNILKKDGSGAFATDRHGHYVWRFQVDTLIDVDPPYVTSVYPEPGATEKRNSIVQINFNEAMDPLVTQGLATPRDTFSNFIFHSQDTTGQWKLTNSYQTVEFLSDIPCGQNSCGEMMYCLAVDCSAGNPQCFNNYEVLIRTALTINQNSFEAVPFSGVMDMAGNALYNGPLDVQNKVPANPHKPGFNASEPRLIHAEERAPDNYNWVFKISNAIDREAPAIEVLSPNLDQENVDENATFTIRMTKRMANYSLDGIKLEEFPKPIDLVQENRTFENLSDIWFTPIALFDATTTVINIKHREFGPQGTNFYYFPIIPSTVKSITQNCFYPGRGPFTVAKPEGEVSPKCEYIQDENGNLVRTNGCVNFPANFTENQDTGCIQYSNPAQDVFVSSTEKCLEILQTPAISPRQPLPEEPAQDSGA